jgi:hypothetical protein
MIVSIVYTHNVFDVVLKDLYLLFSHHLLIGIRDAVKERLLTLCSWIY